MDCAQCGKKAIYKAEHGGLCQSHFLRYLEKKVHKCIRDYNLIQKEDVLGVGVSGGKDSLALLYLLLPYCKKRGVSLKAICIDEGIHGYRKDTLDDAKQFFEEHGVEHYIYSYEGEFGEPLDEILKHEDIRGTKPCTICGVLRRYLLNKKTRELGCTKLATGHNLDDEAQTALMNALNNRMDLFLRNGPITYADQIEGFIPRIKPLFFVSEKEVMLFAHLKGFVGSFTECPNMYDGQRFYFRKVINDVERRFPGSKHKLINFELEAKAHAKPIHKPMQYCESCGEPSAKPTCSACETLGKLGLTASKN